MTNPISRTKPGASPYSGSFPFTQEDRNQRTIALLCQFRGEPDEITSLLAIASMANSWTEAEKRLIERLIDVPALYRRLDELLDEADARDRAELAAQSPLFHDPADEDSHPPLFEPCGLCHSRGWVLHPQMVAFDIARKKWLNQHRGAGAVLTDQFLDRYREWQRWWFFQHGYAPTEIPPREIPCPACTAPDEWRC